MAPPKLPNRPCTDPCAWSLYAQQAPSDSTVPVFSKGSARPELLSVRCERMLVFLHSTTTTLTWGARGAKPLCRYKQSQDSGQNCSQPRDGARAWRLACRSRLEVPLRLQTPRVPQLLQREPQVPGQAGCHSAARTIPGLRHHTDCLCIASRIHCLLYSSPTVPPINTSAPSAQPGTDLCKCARPQARSRLMPKGIL